MRHENVYSRGSDCVRNFYLIVMQNEIQRGVIRLLVSLELFKLLVEYTTARSVVLIFFRLFSNGEDRILLAMSLRIPRRLTATVRSNPGSIGKQFPAIKPLQPLPLRPYHDPRTDGDARTGSNFRYFCASARVPACIVSTPFNYPQLDAEYSCGG